MRKIIIGIVFAIIIVGVLVFLERYVVHALLANRKVRQIYHLSTVRSVYPTIVPIPTETLEQIIWDKQLKSIINPSNNTNVVVRVEKLSVNYAKGIAGNDNARYAWYAIEKNGQWQEVWQGQNSISCKIVRDFNIPKDLYGRKCLNN